MNVAGGAWFFGDPSSAHMGRLVHTAVSRGCAVVSMACTSSRERKCPYQIQEIRCVLRCLAAHSNELCLDCGYLAFWSSSSGGHLSLLTALTTDDPYFDVPEPSAPCPPIAAVVAAYPCCRLDARAEEYHAIGLEPATLRSGPKCAESIFLGVENVLDHPDLIKLGSPTYRLCAGLPPVILLHGTKDDILPYTLTLEFARRYRELNGAEKILTKFIAGVGHSAPCFKENPMCYEILDFLDRVRAGQVPCPPERQGVDEPVDL